jgi:hypothetical protein
MPAWLQDIATFAVYTAAVAAAILHLRRITGTEEGGSSCGSCDHAPRGTVTSPTVTPPTAKRAKGLVVLGNRGESGR